MNLPKFKLTGEILAKTAVNQILASPETWNQREWHSACGTKHCFAGWCQILSGRPANSYRAMTDAAEALGFTELEADWFFRPTCSLCELHYMAAHFGDGYDRDGYDRDGYNRAGYNRAGYNRAGYNRDGYNRAGYDRAGKKLEPFKLEPITRPGRDYDELLAHEAGEEGPAVCDRCGCEFPAGDVLCGAKVPLCEDCRELPEEEGEE